MPSAKQAAVGVTGKKEVKVRNYDFSNIKEVVLGGETYKLVPDDGEAEVKVETKTKIMAKKRTMRAQLTDIQDIGDSLKRMVIAHMNNSGARQ